MSFSCICLFILHASVFVLSLFFFGVRDFGILSTFLPTFFFFFVGVGRGYTGICYFVIAGVFF